MNFQFVPGDDLALILQTSTVTRRISYQCLFCV